MGYIYWNIVQIYKSFNKFKKKFFVYIWGGSLHRHNYLGTKFRHPRTNQKKIITSIYITFILFSLIFFTCEYIFVPIQIFFIFKIGPHTNYWAGFISICPPKWSSCDHWSIYLRIILKSTFVLFHWREERKHCTCLIEWVEIPIKFIYYFK
jgi:hypothetical protein